MITQPPSRLLARAAALVVSVTSASLLLASAPASAQYNTGNDRYQGQDDRYDRDNGGYRDDDRGYRDDQSDRDDNYADDENNQDAPDVTYFYDELEDQGRWETHPTYGQVFIPRGIDADWRPYTRGHWVNTEEHGWYWDSDEPFGWATYHYGRWHFDDRIGWVWVPGTTWAPAWVAWRSNDEHVGWAPLPPDSYWEPRRGLVYDTALYESPRFSIYWSFVEPRYVVERDLWHHCAPRNEVTTIIYRTRPQTNYVFVNQRIVNRGVSVTNIQRVTHTQITTYNIYGSQNRFTRGVNRQAGNTIRVYRPNLARAHVAAVRQQRGVKAPVIRQQTTWTNVDRPRGLINANPRSLNARRPGANPALRAARPQPGNDKSKGQQLQGTTFAPAARTYTNPNGGGGNPNARIIQNPGGNGNRAFRQGNGPGPNGNRKVYNGPNGPNRNAAALRNTGLPGANQAQGVQNQNGNDRPRRVVKRVKGPPGGPNPQSQNDNPPPNKAAGTTFAPATPR